MDHVQRSPLYLVPLAYGIDTESGLPDKEARARCQPLLQTARGAEMDSPRCPYYFVLGGGMPKKTEPYARSLAHATKCYLLEEHISPERIIMNPRGYNTVTEAWAVKEVISAFPTGRVIAATSLWHGRRAQSVFSILFPDRAGRESYFYCCMTQGTTTLEGKALQHAMRHERIGFLKSCIEAWSIRLGLVDPWQTRRAHREGFVAA